MAKSAPTASGFDAAAPRSIVAGIGCRRGVATAEIIALIEAAFAAADQSMDLLVAIASLDIKAAEPGLLAAAAYFEVPLRTFTATELTASDARGSTKIQSLVGAPSVAEAAACMAGPLLLPKRQSSHATCALAFAGPSFNLASFGQAAPASTASMAASRSLTSNAGP